MLLLSLLALNAVAARPTTLTVAVVDEAGEPVATAAVVADFEDERSPVNMETGEWKDDVLIGRNDAELRLARGVGVEGWVVAPGFSPARFSTIVKGRKSRVTVRLQSLDTRPGSVPLPLAEEADEVRRALREAAAALQMQDLVTADQRLDAADRRRIALEGAPYVDSTLAVMEMRTLIGLAAWERRLAAHRKDPSDATARAMKVSRGVTADLALDWRDYARGAGRPDARAVAFCRTASGRVGRCE